MNLVNIGSADGLLADNTRLLPEPYDQWCYVVFTLEQYHKKCSKYQAINHFDNYST